MSPPAIRHPVLSTKSGMSISRLGFLPYRFLEIAIFQAPTQILSATPPLRRENAERTLRLQQAEPQAHPKISLYVCDWISMRLGRNDFAKFGAFSGTLFPRQENSRRPCGPAACSFFIVFICWINHCQESLKKFNRYEHSHN